MVGSGLPTHAHWQEHPWARRQSRSNALLPLTMPPSDLLWSSSAYRVKALALFRLIIKSITQADSLPGNRPGLGNRLSAFALEVSCNRDELAGSILLPVTPLGIITNRWKPTQDASMHFSWMPDEYLSITVACSVLGFSSCRTRTRISAVILAHSLHLSCPGPRDEQGHKRAHTGQFTACLRASLLYAMCRNPLFLQVGVTGGVSSPLFLKNLRR